MGPRSEGERLTAAYLRQRRLPYEYEPEIGGRNPDFLVHHPLGDVVLEVYEPDTGDPATGQNPYTPLRRAFDSATKKKQIAAVKAAGLPYVAVVRPQGFSVPPSTMSEAMFGDSMVTIAIDTTTGGPVAGPEGEPQWVYGGGGRLQPKLNRGVSAVALVTRFNPTMWRVHARHTARLRAKGLSPPRDLEEAARSARIHCDVFDELLASGAYDKCARLARLEVLHNPHATHKLSLEAFGGPHDEQ